MEKKKSEFSRYPAEDKTLLIIGYVILGLFIVAIILPMVYIILASFIDPVTLQNKGLTFDFSKWTVTAYKRVLENKQIWVGFGNALLYSVLFTVISVVVTLLAAYPMSRADFKGKKFFNTIFVITMFFGGGLIPTYLLISNLGMLDTIWAILIPGAFSVWNMIIARTYYVTHDQTEAMTLGDRIVIMKDGFVNQIGTPVEVFDKPVNLFVAGFIGMPVMNFFDGCKLLLENGKYYAEIRGVKFELSEFQQKALKSNEQKPCDIIVGIRPQHISVGEGRLSAKIEVSEMMGSEYNIHARSGDDEVVMVIPTVGLETDVSMGASVKFNTQPGLIQLFDKVTGNNLVWYDADSAANNAPVCKNYGF